MGLYKHNRPLFFASLIAIGFVLFSMYLSFTTLNAYARDVQVLFANIESFAQYMADNYGWTIPDVRIFFKDGTVTEINTNKAEG